jgi:hypothetical protein
MSKRSFQTKQNDFRLLIGRILTKISLHRFELAVVDAIKSDGRDRDLREGPKYKGRQERISNAFLTHF